ncbi:alpha-2-HS-glycoprotein-like isoform X1 [Trematomus bernacchii]|uniref:alpha-2-HS-glycoprotein-like isoform X1 n=1 Tax=Trematomus bernacchii TaxID=40690 RepID=UPI00146E2BA5|nr:alpha-2-HS-glycoprotein-like isoform X1 [Trematomus bernacchii]
MNALGVTVVLGLLLGVWAQTNIERPQCDSPEAEEAALAAQDYLNAQHTHGYKYALNRIEDIKVYTKPDGDNTYKLEIELLETDCHVLDPTPLANCTVRPKRMTAVEGDCDVLLKRVGGVMTVTAFKCKTEESTEDLCLGCATLLPLNDTTALDFVHASLATFNNMTEKVTYAVMEVGRMSSKVVSGGLIYLAEYVVVEANCTDDPCVPLNDAMAARGFCTARGSSIDHLVDCKMFLTMMPIIDANSTVADTNSTAAADTNSTAAADTNSTVADTNSTVADTNSTAAADTNSTAAASPAMPQMVHIHTGSLSPKLGLRYHKLTTLHDPEPSGFLSSESTESAEVVPVAPAVVAAAADPAADAAPAADAGSDSDSSNSAEVLVIVKIDVPVAAAPVVDPIVVVPVCPGRKIFF